jgi:hypothetical protein
MRWALEHGFPDRNDEGLYLSWFYASGMEIADHWNLSAQKHAEEFSVYGEGSGRDGRASVSAYKLSVRHSIYSGYGPIFGNNSDLTVYG